MVAEMHRPVLMPEPNVYRFFSGFFRMKDSEAVQISREVEEIYPELPDVLNKNLKISLIKCEHPSDGRIQARYLEPDDLRLINEAFNKTFDLHILKEEAYFIHIDMDKITIAARDKRGFFYAVQTLKQLIVQRSGKGDNNPVPLSHSGYVTFKNILAFDYPHVKLRGVHVYLPARENIRFFRGFIEGLAELKYNRIYIEVSGMEYKKHPEINEAWLKYCKDMDEYPEKAKTYQCGFPYMKDSIHIENAGGGFLKQDEVKELVKFCKDNLLDIIPEVQSLTHCDYIVIPHREIAERPEDPYPDTYCPSNPRTYEILFDIIDEVIDVFRPNSVNIGHDEWYSSGLCPLCKGKDTAGLLAGDVNKIYSYLKAKGIKTEIWADKFLDAHSPGGRGEGGALKVIENYFTSEIYYIRPGTYKAIDMIPRDILMWQWFWWIEPDGIRRYGEKGMDALYANFNGAAVAEWEKYSREKNLLGGVVSHWDLLEEDNMARDAYMFKTVYAAQAFWNEHYNDLSWERTRDLTIKHLPYFMQTLGGRELPSLSYGQKDYISAFVRHEQREKHYLDTAAVEVRNYRYIDVKHEPGTFRSSVVEMPKAQSFRVAVINDRADSLVFSHNTNISLKFKPADWGYKADEYLIGSYTVKFGDGSTIPVELHYGKNIGNADIDWGRHKESWAVTYNTDARLQQVSYYTRPWIKALNKKEYATVYDFEWINPYPEKEIEEIVLCVENLNTYFSIYVYNIHGIKLL